MYPWKMYFIDLRDAGIATKNKLTRIKTVYNFTFDLFIYLPCRHGLNKITYDTLSEFVI